MKIGFKTKKLQKQLTNPKDMAKRFGVLAKKVNQRMKDLSGAANLAVFKKLPAARCHELKGDLAGNLAVDVSGNVRLIFEPDHNPLPNKNDGGLDWTRVTCITINAVEDYH